MLMLTGMIILAIVWFGVALPLAYLYGKWKFRNGDTLTGEAEYTEERRATRHLKSERRWEAKQRLKIERWEAIGRETAYRAQLEAVKT